LNYLKSFWQLLHNSLIFLSIYYSIFLDFDFLHLKIFIILSYLKFIFPYPYLSFIKKVLHYETMPFSFQLQVLFHLFIKYACLNHFFLLVFLILFTPISFNLNKLIKIHFHFKSLIIQTYHSNYWWFLIVQGKVT